MARRFTYRTYPDVAQTGVPTGTIINQSRVTFTGPKGTVWVIWTTQVAQASAVQVNLHEIGFSGSGITATGIRTEAWIDNVVGRSVGTLNFMHFTDPAAGAFVEMITRNGGGGNLDVGASQSALFAFSFPDDPGGGPIVTIA